MHGLRRVAVQLRPCRRPPCTVIAPTRCAADTSPPRRPPRHCSSQQAAYDRKVCGECPPFGVTDLRRQVGRIAHTLAGGGLRRLAGRTALRKTVAVFGALSSGSPAHCCTGTLPDHRVRRPGRQPMDRRPHRLVHQEVRHHRPPLPHDPDPHRPAHPHRRRPPAARPTPRAQTDPSTLRCALN
jgi:hypothetical protein